MGDFWGLVVLILTFIIIDKNNHILHIKSTIFKCLIFLHSLVIIDIFLYEFLDNADAASFYIKAAQRASLLDFDFLSFTGAEFFTSALGFVMTIFGESQFLCTEIVLLSFTYSIIVLIKLCILFQVETHAKKIILFYCLMPHCALYVIILRETTQILLVMLSIYHFLSLEKTKNTHHIIPLTISLFFLIFFHNGLVLFVSFFLIYILFKQKHHFLIKMILVFIGGYFLINSGHQMLDVASEDKLEYAELYKSRSVDARADYKQGEKSNFNTVLYYIYYLAMPFPWNCSSLKDVIGCFDSMIRCYFLIKAIRRFLKTRNRQEAHLLIFFFALSNLWSLGTTNYGTSARHNVTTFWMVLIMGVPPLLRRNTTPPPLPRSGVSY
jgi:hypothetical protein